MALTITVSKNSVSKVMEKLFSISLNLKCEDEIGSPPVQTTVINKSFSVLFRPGTDSISEKEAELQKQMQDEINKYSNEQAIFNNAQLDTVVDNLNINLNS